MESVKDAFSKVKKDVEFLGNEISFLKKELVQTREELIKICEVMIRLDRKITKNSEKQHEKKENQLKTSEKETPTLPQITQTSSTQTPTHLIPLEALKGQNEPFSSGNGGVPTDRQTDRQTDKREEKNTILREKIFFKSDEIPLKTASILEKTPDFNYLAQNPIDNAAKILESLDSIKKEIRFKFKRLTSQEMIVFSTLYQMEEELVNVDYKILSKKLNLTESSVRDYIGRLIKKGIPVEKKRINNKTILLSISSNLKRITSLSTIMQLRDI
ncbi:MAG: hypothetical protein AABX76_00940 [Nanoarchaeota archaeon]